jgi:hypothetical protein
MSEKEAREELQSVSKEHLPNVVTNLLVAFLIWLFGVLVFLPAANQILPQRIPLTVSLVILIGFTIFVVRTINNGLPTLIDSASNVMAYDYINWRKTQFSIEKIQPTIKSIFIAVALLTFYLSYSPLLITIHPSLNGLVLIPIVLWILWTTLKIINMILIEK